MSNDTQTISEHDEIELLLPWYATGKLSRTDSDRVAAYLKRHPEMGAQMAVINEDMSETVRANEALTASANRALERLMAATKPSSFSAAVGTLRSRFSSFLSVPSSLALECAAVAAAVLIVAQAVIIGSLVMRPAPTGYETAAGSPASVAAGTFAIVRFAPDATAADIAAALADRGAQIVEGPKPGGLYRLRIGAKAISEDERADLVQALRSQRAVFALVAPEN